MLSKLSELNLYSFIFIQSIAEKCFPLDSVDGLNEQEIAHCNKQETEGL